MFYIQYAGIFECKYFFCGFFLLYFYTQKPATLRLTGLTLSTFFLYFFLLRKQLYKLLYSFIFCRISFQLFVSSFITFSSFPLIFSNTNLTFAHEISLKSISFVQTFFFFYIPTWKYSFSKPKFNFIIQQVCFRYFPP